MDYYSSCYKVIDKNKFTIDDIIENLIIVKECAKRNLKLNEIKVKEITFDGERFEIKLKK